MKNTTRILANLVVLLFVQGANAFVTPLSVNVVNPVQFPPDDFSVAGLRLSALWGQHRDMYGLDFGLLGNVTEQTFTGPAASGVFNITKGTTTAIGLQAAGVANLNYNKTKVYGLQLAGAINSNTAESKLVGLQVALLGNIAGHTHVYGAQIGLYNRAKSVTGLQIGLVNVTDNLRGIQIGLANFHHTGLFAVSPIINVGF